MKEIAQDFFAHQEVRLNKNTPFEQTDLYEYLYRLYGNKPIISQTAGFIKVIDQEDHFLLSEHLFYDYYPDKADYFITLENFEGTSHRIKNNALGLSLSKKGYAATTCPDPKLPQLTSQLFTTTPETKTTKVFNESYWGEPDFKNPTHPDHLNPMNELFYTQLNNTSREMTDFSDILCSANKSNIHCVRWPQGLRQMSAHHECDYRVFFVVNLYVTEGETAGALTFGEYDWYDTTMKGLKKNGLSYKVNPSSIIENTDTDVPIKNNQCIILNTFNPKFYHEVKPVYLDKPLYVGVVDYSYESITQHLKIDDDKGGSAVMIKDISL